MQRNKTSVSREDYLKAIWEMLEENQVPISARLAEELDVTPPAVTAAIKRMARDGHVKVQRGGRILLHRQGPQSCASISRFATNSPKCFSPKSIGLSWAKAHAEAERMEHAHLPRSRSSPR